MRTKTPYEYKVTIGWYNNYASDFDKLGAEGWELIRVVALMEEGDTCATTIHCVFRRTFDWYKPRLTPST